VPGLDGTRVTVVGAGLGGSLLAVLLGRAGATVTLLERRLDPRQTGAEEGRSINLALSARGLHALEHVGLADQVLAQAVPLPGRMIHLLDGGRRFQPYGREGQSINSVSRSNLNVTLLDAAERVPGLRIRFGARCLDVEPEAATVEVEDVRTGARDLVAADLVVGTDGAFSAVRRRLQRLDRFDYRQDFLEHGYKELTIPPGPDGGWRLEPHAMHIWPRGGFMMMAMANADHSFTVTLYLPFEGPNGFAGLGESAEVLRFFETRFPDAVPLIPDLAGEFLANPTGSLVTVRCAPWHAAGRVVLLGDAAHAMVPFYGQGANASFEDCLELVACLGEFRLDRARALAEYQDRRKPNADAIADLAIENFLEMRDRVASPVFHARKRLEKHLHQLFPQAFTPLYTMISFSRIPYAAARRRAARQWRVVWTVMALLAVLMLFALEAAWR
jgi:kynurenine 3-monooxygenase